MFKLCIEMLCESDIVFVWYLIAVNLICVQIILFISLFYQTKRWYTDNKESTGKEYRIPLSMCE